jgi:hypothetical protein
MAIQSSFSFSWVEFYIMKIEATDSWFYELVRKFQASWKWKSRLEQIVFYLIDYYENWSNLQKVTKHGDWLIWNLECEMQKSHMFVCNQKPLPDCERVYLYIYTSNSFACNNHDWWKVDISCKAKNMFKQINLYYCELIFSKANWYVQKAGDKFWRFMNKFKFYVSGMAKCGASFGWRRNKLDSCNLGWRVNPSRVTIMFM